MEKQKEEARKQREKEAEEAERQMNEKRRAKLLEDAKAAARQKVLEMISSSPETIAPGELERLLQQADEETEYSFHFFAKKEQPRVHACFFRSSMNQYVLKSVLQCIFNET